MLTVEKSQLTSVVWDEDKVFVSKCLELDIVSVGDSMEDAISNLKEAVGLYLKNVKLLGNFDELYPQLISLDKTTTYIEIEI